MEIEFNSGADTVVLVNFNCTVLWMRNKCFIHFSILIEDSPTFEKNRPSILKDLKAFSPGGGQCYCMVKILLHSV